MNKQTIIHITGSFAMYIALVQAFLFEYITEYLLFLSATQLILDTCQNSMYHVHISYKIYLFPQKNMKISFLSYLF